MSNPEQSHIQINAAFIDRLIQRWEVLVEHHIRVRHEGYDPSQDEGAAEQQVRATLGAIDQQLDGLRREIDALRRLFPLDQVVVTYHLDAVEASILQLALVPQLDLSFRNRIARFNNNILLDFVDVDLALTLLFPNREQRLQARRYFATDAPLFSNRLLTLAPPKDPKGSGVLAQELKPPERLADFVLGRRSLDASLRPYAELIEPTVLLEDVALPPDEAENLVNLVRHFATKAGLGPSPGKGPAAPFPVGPGLAVELAGPPGTGKTMLAHALAHELSRPLIQVNCGALANISQNFVDVTDALFTEARVQGAVLVFDRCEPLFKKESNRVPTVLHQMERFGGLTILTTSKPDELESGVERYVAWHIDLAMPEMEQRFRIWQIHMPEDVELAAAVDLDDVATRFEITGGQIKNAWAVAVRTAAAARAPDAEGPVVIEQDTIRHAAHAQIRANMDDYSVRSKVTLSLDDLVLPDREMTLVREVLEACRNRVFVMSKWGFAKRLVTGKGICVLFKGEPGTGKTLCAEILAAELGMKLYQVSIPKIVSKYIGETEKNISKIFHSARASHSMLLFDEADSLFTKRVSVENAIDRFSNMETNLLLQEIERFEGVTILTTNLDKNIDDAFARRIQFKIDFPFPEADGRELIWRSHFPKECPLDDDIDFVDLAEDFELAGGNIKNAVVRAAYRAAGRGDPISYADIEFAAAQECKNAGKLFRTGRKHDDW